MSTQTPKLTTLRKCEGAFPVEKLPSEKFRETLHPNRVTGYGMVMSYAGLVSWLAGRITQENILEWAGLGAVGAGMLADFADGQIARSHPLLQTEVGKSFDPLVDKLVNYPTQLVILVSFLLTIGFNPITVTMALLAVIGMKLDITSTQMRLGEGETLTSHALECFEGFIAPKDAELATPEGPKTGANILGKIKTLTYSITNAVMLVLMSAADTIHEKFELQGDPNDTLRLLAGTATIGYGVATGASLASLRKKKKESKDTST